MSGLGIGVSFLGAQYLFCAVVRGPKLKGRMPVTRSLSDEDLQRRQVVQMTELQPSSLRNGGVPEELPVGGAATARGGGGGSGGGGGVAVHGLPGGGSGGSGSSGGDGRGRGTGSGVGSSSSSSSSNGVRKNNKVPSTSGTPESEVPYFLRNHKSAWQFILPDAVAEVALPNVSSRCSTLSRSSKSSFQPYRPTNMEPYNPRAHLQPQGVLRVPRASSSRPSSRPSSRLSSSCSTSLYSVHESCRGESPARRGGGKVVRPSVPPPAPPPSTSQSDSLRSHAVGGWESCAVIQFPAQGGGGFVIDLD